MTRCDGGEAWEGAATYWPGAGWAPGPPFHGLYPWRAFGDGFSKRGVMEHLSFTIPRCCAIKFGTSASKNGADRTRDAKTAREKERYGPGFDRWPGF